MGAVALMALAGCSDKEPTLMNVRASGNGPDEFAILPPKPLQLPENLVELPQPTPGGFNRTDPTPNDDAIVAMGGKRAGRPWHRGAGSCIAGTGPALWRRCGIRQVLAAEDLEYRRKNDGRLLERLVQRERLFQGLSPNVAGSTGGTGTLARVQVRATLRPRPPKQVSKPAFPKDHVYGTAA